MGERGFRIDRRETHGVIKRVKQWNRFPREIAKSLLQDAPGPTWLVEVWRELPGHHSGYARFVVSCLSCLLRPLSLGFGVSCPVERRGHNIEHHPRQDCPSTSSGLQQQNQISPLSACSLDPKPPHSRRKAQIFNK